jgi:tetratricopeptide (TPR) repeat protein
MSAAKQILFFITQIFFYTVSFSQAGFFLSSDSLKKLLSTEIKEDTIRANRLFYLSNSYIYDNPDSGIYYADSALRLSRKLGYTIREAWANFNLGEAYLVLGDYALSMQYYLQSLELFQQMKRPIGVSTMKYCIGNIYKEMSDYKQALQYYFEARKMDEENPDDLKLMLPDISIDDRLVVNDLYIADAYLVGNILDSALFFAKRGFAKDRKLRRDWIYPALVLGNVYFKRNQLDSALYCYRLTFKQTAQNDRIDINNGIADIFRKRNQPDSCRYYATMAFDTAQLIHYLKAAMHASELLGWVYEKINPAEAMRYYKINIAIKDSLYDREKLSRINFLVFAEKQKEQELHATQEKYQDRLKMYGLLVIVAFFLIIALFLWRSNRHRQKAYALLQKQTENELQIQKLESEKKEEALKHQATELEMQALRAQMNPHFIFNCLSSINRFILKNKTEEASDYLTKFSRLIRMVLNNSKRAFISLEDELETLRLYLDMERLRFKKSFNYSFTYTNSVEAGNIFIPPLLLQPFAENAIWHGLMHKQEKGFLNFNFSAEENFLTCAITDDGIGRKKAAMLKSKSAVKQKSMGLKITRERLGLLNNNSNEQTFFTIEDLTDENGKANGTRVHLKIFYKEMVEVEQVRSER